jgi:cyclophilin family peptidyl-prolyl cis-trans isomerase
MRQTNLLAAALAVLILAGAGCAAQTNVAIPSDEANSDSALTPRPLNLNREPEAAAPSATVPTPAPTPKPAGDSTNSPTTAPSAMDTRPIQKTYRFPGLLPKGEIHGKQVRLQTDKGEIVFDLLDSAAPKTVSNFVYLANAGYYNALTFHRVVPGFVIQGGDPAGDGTGGPGYKFEDEPIPNDLTYDAGIVAMANSGPNTNGSQFFIMLDDNQTLPKSYTIFGRVTKGQDVVRAINVGDVMRSVIVESK